MNAHNEQQWPEYLMLRDTGLADDAGGLGQRIFTTAGAGYVKQKYVRADIAAQPAAAQEAVDAMLAMGFIWDSGAWRAQSDGGMQDERNRWFIRAGEYLKRAQDAEAKLASTPAAPGIDLTPLWRLSDTWLKALGVRGLGDEEKRLRWAMAKELRDALSLIDATPKGGSDARDAERYRWLRESRGTTWDQPWVAVGHYGRPYDQQPNEIEGKQLDDAIDAAMQAQAGDAEVQP